MFRETYAYFVVHKTEKPKSEVNPVQILKRTMCYFEVVPLNRSTFIVYSDKCVKQTMRTSSA